MVGSVAVLRGAGSGGCRAADDRHQRCGRRSGPCPASRRHSSGISSSSLRPIWTVFPLRSSRGRAGGRLGGLRHARPLAREIQGPECPWVTVTNAEDRTIASSAPERFPPLEAMRRGGTWRCSAAADDILVEDETCGSPHDALAGLSGPGDRADLCGGRYLRPHRGARAVRLRELVLTNGLLTLLLVAFGTFSMRWLLRPVGLLSRYLRAGREGSMPPIPEEVVSEPEPRVPRPVPAIQCHGRGGERA